MQLTREREGPMPSAEQADQQRRQAGGVCSGPQIPGHRLQFEERTHSWVIDGLRIACPPAASACLTLLLEQAGQCVPFARLMEPFAEGTSVNPALYQTRIKLRRLISDLRAKLWPLGMDIVSVMGVGYLLRCLTEEEETRLL